MKLELNDNDNLYTFLEIVMPSSQIIIQEQYLVIFVFIVWALK